eukprot:TRINITY_DN35135_c0_g1_i4.p1 TRINITY_DN35135_c0_g1~~TRINITY_DN35135_c0_g1_i4.p1  ORF type:complete len:503 (-),score=75.11 TRINITY_DN35135_c0_g1_i4:90-1598(-)
MVVSRRGGDTTTRSATTSSCRRRLLRTPDADGRPSDAPGACVSVTYEHVLREQCFAVAEKPKAAWAYPLLVALSAKRDDVVGRRPGDPADVRSLETEQAMASLVAAVADTVRSYLASGQMVLDAGAGVAGEIAAMLPCGSRQMDSGGAVQDVWMHDDVSPVASHAAVGAGSVCVSWEPAATTWFHDDDAEATVDSERPPSPQGGGSEVLASVNGGRFWQRFDANGSWVETLCAQVLPLDSQTKSITGYISEASEMLRRNRAEGGPSFAGDFAPAELHDDWSAGKSGPAGERMSEASIGWLLERDEVAADVGRISVFRSSGRLSLDRLVRVLFADGTRMDFSARAADHGQTMYQRLRPVLSEPVRLLNPDGERLHRSFTAHQGSEAHFQAALLLLDWLAVDPEGYRTLTAHAAAVNDAVVAAERRRATCLLLSQGTVGHEGLAHDGKPGGAADGNAHSLDMPASSLVDLLERSQRLHRDIQDAIGGGGGGHAALQCRQSLTAS